MKRLLACALIPCSLYADTGLLHYSNPNGEVTIDASASGNLVGWKVGGLEMARENHEPVLVMRGENVSLPFQVTHTQTSQSDTGWKVVLEGHFAQKESVLLAGSLTYTIPNDFSQIEAELRFDPPAKESSFQVRDLLWQTALATEPRKRVFFQGEHGLAWDTTYFYQFHVDAINQLLREPERNEWRFIGLDQLGPNAFQLWKAESGETPRLLMQEGAKVAPFVQVYDAKKGIAVEAPGLAATAPKRLLVDAAGGATVRLELWPLRKPLLSLSSEAFRKAATASPHRIILHATQGDAALLALRESLVKKAELPAPPKPATLLAEPEWLEKSPVSAGQARYVTGGYPFAQGELKPDGGVAVRIGGVAVPAQARPLAYWPDGSVKWAGITARLPEGKTEPAAAPPWVSFRDGSRLSLEVAPGKPEAPGKPLVTKQGEETVEINTGALHAVLGTGRKWLRSLTLSGKPLLAGDGAAYANYQLDFKSLSSVTGELGGGAADDADLLVNRVELVEAGPLRSVVRLEGMVTNKEPTRVILWMEFLAGRPEIKLTHSVEFLFKDPRRTVLTGLGLKFPVALGARAECRLPGVEKPLSLDGEGRIALDQLTPNFSEVLESRAGGNRVVSTGGESQGWLEVRGETARLLAVCRDFWEMAPKAISITRGRDGNGVVQFGLWPEDAPAMDVRRYSNYPHKGQSEALSDLNHTIPQDYYAHDPFVGVSRSHEVLLGFYPAGADVDARARAADFQSPPLIYAGWPRYEQTKVALPGYAPQSPLGEKGLQHFAEFWRYHQALHRWYGFWHYGDFRHYFQDGYGWTLPPEKLAEALSGKPGPRGRVVLGPREKVLSYHPANDWAFDNGRWGWSNTEGLPGFFFENQYLRTGDRAAYFTSEALARHSRDVVIRHAGKWFGLGTRHGVQHWSDGNHEERQTTATEYKLHYYLSGEPRSRDVIERLYEGRYSNTPVAVDAAHSGRLQGLLFHWEVTNDPKEGEQLKRYLHAMKGEGGIYEEANLGFPGPVPLGPPKGLNKGSMFFHLFGGMHAILEYEMITKDPEVRSMLIAAADSMLANPKAIDRWGQGRYSPVSYGPIGFAAREAENPAPYRKLLRDSFQAGGWKKNWQMVTANPQHWTGPTAHLGASVPGSLFWMNFAPYLFGSLEEKDLARPAILNAMAAVEEKGDPKKFQPIALQGEYDGNPRLEPYLSKDRPWAAGTGGSAAAR